MSDDEKPKRRRKEPRWGPMPADERPHEKARRGVNRLIYGIDTKRPLHPD